MNFLAYNKEAKLYAISRHPGTGDVRNIKESKDEKYQKKNIKKYVEYLKYLGGDIYAVPNSQTCIVYEQTGKNPAETDKIVQVFGDNIKLPR